MTPRHAWKGEACGALGFNCKLAPRGDGGLCRCVRACAALAGVEGDTRGVCGRDAGGVRGCVCAAGACGPRAGSAGVRCNTPARANAFKVCAGVDGGRAFDACAEGFVCAADWGRVCGACAAERCASCVGWAA